eukprot:5446563-Lingulodinium_polyedra.AAC.1
MWTRRGERMPKRLGRLPGNCRTGVKRAGCSCMDPQHAHPQHANWCTPALVAAIRTRRPRTEPPSPS